MIIGFTCGVFDLFHAGHVLMLKECKEHCDFLIVAINTATNINYEINKGKNSPIFSISDRELIITSCKYVDKVFTYSTEEELLKIIDNEIIHIRFLGDDYLGKSITKSNKKIDIKFINRDHGKSTSGYIKQILKKYEVI